MCILWFHLFAFSVGCDGSKWRDGPCSAQTFEGSREETSTEGNGAQEQDETLQSVQPLNEEFLL
jgi:hypothetical protein